MIRLTNLIAPSFYDVHKSIKANEYTHYWMYGGRGSTKSSVISIEIVLGMMKDPDANAIVMRKVGDTLKTSVFEQLVWAIDNLGVRQHWDVPKANLILTYKPTGQQIRFRGVDDPKKIKGTKFSRGYTKFVWFEECEEFNGMEEIRMVNQSLMRGGEQFVVFYSYNPPKSSNSWVNVESKITRPDRLNHHSTYLDVDPEWLGHQFLIEANHLKEVKPLAYQHEYLGEAIGTGGEVFDNVSCRAITDEEIANFWNVKRGIDFGYSRDPASYGVMHYDRKVKTLYIFHELYKVGLSNYELNTHVAAENVNNELIYCDSSEPKSISELLQYGRRVAGVKKGKDSIDYGIKFLQSLESIIIDDKRCPETAREFLTYELDRDNNGNFKAGYPDRNNHTIDMARYALNEEALLFRDKKEKSNLHPSMDDSDRIQRNIERFEKKQKRGNAW